MKIRRFTEEEIRAIETVVDHYKMEELSIMFGRSKGVLYNKIRSIGINKRYIRKTNTEKKYLAYSMFLQSDNASEVAKKLGVTKNTILRWVMDYAKTQEAYKERYWTTEEEIEKSLSLEYKPEELTGEELAIYRTLI